MTAPSVPASILLALAMPQAAATTSGTYRAIGTEPFWALSITATEARLEEPGRRATVLPQPVVRITPQGRRYEADGLSVAVIHRPCSDGMSDNRYADTVTVHVAGRVLHGCGGLIRARPVEVPRTIRPGR